MEKKRGRGRPRIYLSEQERRNEEYRQRRVRKDDLLGFFEALTQAFERAGCHPIFDHLPEGPGERIREAVRRLDAVKLVAFQREEDVIEQLSLPFSGRTNATRERSRAAAERAAVHVNRRQREVLEYLASRGDAGATDNGLIAYVVGTLGGSANGPRARRVELVRAGLIEPTGEEKDGSTVWRISAAGRAALEDDLL